MVAADGAARQGERAVEVVDTTASKGGRAIAAAGQPTRGAAYRTDARRPALARCALCWPIPGVLNQSLSLFVVQGKAGIVLPDDFADKT